MKNLNVKNQNGRSMIEMLGVLAIIGVLSVGGIAGYSKAMMKYRINKTIEQITLIAGNIRTFFAPQRSYAGLNNTVIKKAKLVPDEVWDSNKTSLNNIWGGGFFVDSFQKGDNDRSKGLTGCSRGCDAIRMQLVEIPVEACIELASQDWSNVASNTIVCVSPNGTDTEYCIKSPLSLDEAVTICTTPEVTTMFFDLYIDVDPLSTFWSTKLTNCSIAKGGC